MAKLWILVGVAAFAVACAPGSGADEGAGGLGFSVRALTDNCSGLPGSDPTSEIARLVARVTGPGATGLTEVKAEVSFDIGSKSTASIVVPGIPVSMNNDVTLLGYASGSDTTPSWYGRKRQVPVLADQDNTVDVVLARYARFTCLSDPSNTFTHRAFPASARLGDGKVLVTGGFEHVTVAGTTATFDAASDKAFLYNPATGELEPTATTMTAGRAGHAMVYLPLATGEKVIVFGGSQKMTMRVDGNFPFSIEDTDSLRDYEVYDVASKTFEAAGTDGSGNPKQMLLKRAFLSAVRLFDDSDGSTILVTGGGSWPKDANPDYLKAEIWASYVDDGKGGMQELAANRPQMFAAHNGAGVAKLEDTKEGLSRFLMVGGNDKKDVVEVYTQSSQQKEGVSGVFKELAATGLPALYFPTVTRLVQRRFLVTGGAGIASAKLTAPSTDAFLLEISTSDVVKVTKIQSDCAKRFFHTATATYEGDMVTILGGFADLNGEANAQACTFHLYETGPDPADPAKTISKFAPGFALLGADQEAFLPRAGQVVEALMDDTLLVAGGIATEDTLATATPGFLEIYASPAIKLDLAAE
jgi:hypothetical protein